jgi:decaheme cytochrome c component MtrC/MtrF-like protein
MRLRSLILCALVGGITLGCDGATGPAGPQGPAGPSGPSGPAGQDGSPCSVTANGNGTYTIACPGSTPVTVADGAAGADGSSCDVTANGDATYTISCTDGSTVTVRDGAAGVDGADGTSCTVADNHDGTSTISCGDGRSVTISNGTPGGGTVEIASLHGAAYLGTTGEFAAGKKMVHATITAATADAAGVATVQLTVADDAGAPVLDVPSVAATIAKLVPPAATGDASRWVSYVYRTETVTGSGFPNPAGTTAVQAYRESNGTFTNHGDGSYTYVLATDLSSAMAGTTPVAYERGLTHRVSIMMGGHSGPTADASFDFVPDGAAATVTRDIVQTGACKSCHGEEFHGHGGDRLTVENCATCHVPGSVDANGGESLDLKVMIHKIHAGGELASLAGPDGIVWDNPTTTPDESADNGEYAIWGYADSKHEWWKAEFPAVIENCQKCHQGTGADVDAWKTNPTREACGSCHDTVNFATGANHAGGPAASDQNCGICHGAAGIAPVAAAHDWTTKDERNLPEFDVALTVSVPANGSHFVAGEAPVVTIALTDVTNGSLLDHTTVVEDPSAEGCVTSPCPARDGLFTNAALFVSGPRAHRVPVLTTAARAAVLSTTTGPWDLSAASATLVLKVDGGQDLVMRDVTNGDFLAPATITVQVSAGTFADKAVATTSEIVAWLNANAAFKRRAIAYDQGGKVGIRSRNLGRVASLQLQASAVTTAVFAGDVTAHLPSGSTPSNNVAQRTVAANNDPKATRTPASIAYQLDPVDDLAPGTYVASVEIADRGRISATNYKTPSVAKVAFQVKTATVEKPVAGNCASCHQGPDGRGFILDYSRHYKIFGDDAVDQCGACHDYQPQLATGGGWSGARPISKRVHAVHYGSSLFTPLLTVDYSGGDPVPGRNWDITFPQDVRSCETCHPEGTSSGTWATKAARLPCMGCHDSDAAKAHMKLQTWDPTPLDAWSGDEEESCQACH